MTTPANRAQFDQVMVPNYSPLSAIPIVAKGSRVWDQNGMEYIDFAGGIAVNALGHCHPELIHTLRHQAEKLWHLSNVWTNEPAIRLAQALCDKTFAERVYFANSGAEANEAAFKLARKFAYEHFGNEKYEIISCCNSFHGRTLFTVAVGGQPKYCEGFQPVPEGISHVPFNDCDALEAAVSDKTCAVVIEPVQGEGGIIPASDAFLETARDLCNQYNALLIFDEIQTGVGRTGTLYAYQDTPVVPDIMTTAKALGGGFPIGAMLCTETVAQAFSVGSHGSTYGGNPLACAVASKVLALVDTPQVLNGVSSRHALFQRYLKEANTDAPLFKQIRGKGLLIGCELKSEFDGLARPFIQAAEQAGLMLLMAGPSVIRLAPSLIIPEQDIVEGVERMQRVMRDFISKA